MTDSANTNTAQASTKETAIQVSWLDRVNLIYGFAGLMFISQFAGNGAWKSFVAGWVVAVVNFELLKRIGSVMLALYQGNKISPAFYGLLVGKFAFFGMVIALLSLASWLQAIPFVIGMTTLLISGLGLGMREYLYAR